MNYSIFYVLTTKLLFLALGAGTAFLIVGLIAASLQDLDEENNLE